MKINREDFAELVRRRPDLEHHFRYVRAGGHIKQGYWRRKAKDEKDRRTRKPAKLKAQVAFGSAGYSVYGERGLREGIPVAASAVRKTMKGKSYRESTVVKMIRQLSEALKEIAEVVVETEGKKKKNKKRKK